MASQTQAGEVNGVHRSPPSAFAHHIGELAHDAVALSELQTELLLLDARDCSNRIRLPIVLLAAGAVTGLAAFPVFITAVAQILVEYAHLSEWLGLTIAASGALILGAIAVGIGFALLIRSLEAFQRSQQEFQRNIAWIKRVLKQKRPAAPPRPTLAKN